MVVYYQFTTAGGEHDQQQKSIPVFTAYFTVLAYGILGKSRLFLAQPLEDCLTGLTGSSTQSGTGCTDLHLIGSSVAN